MDQELKEKGLYGKYIISKSSGKPMDENALYFVMRYDKHGKDPVHTQACRDAMLVYADRIKDHLPVLANDIIYNVNKENE